jgi:molybdopterin converting factor small subunit
VRVRVVAFATAAQALGAPRRELELPAGARLADLARALAAIAPALGSQLPRLALAVDGELARADRELAEGCEVALLPPVSGG